MNRKIIFFLVENIAFPFIRWLFQTQKIEIEGLELFKEAAAKGPLLLSLWHENLLIMPFLLSREFKDLSISGVTSRSRDGELLEILKKHFPNVDTIRVKHDARHGSLRSMLSAIKQNKIIVITPDGPQGPWKEVKEGLLKTSSWTKTPIWCLTWSSSKTAHLSTQDKMKFPWPFQKVKLQIQQAGIYDESSEAKAHIKSLLG